MQKTRIFSATLLFFLASAFFFSTCLVFAQTVQPEATLQSASSAVNQAFASVLSAEKAGANVTGLLNQLNTANNLLAAAENAYRTGNNATALNDANAVLPITQQVSTTAQNAKENAITSSRNSFWFTITSTIIALIVLVLVLYFVWRVVKRNYVKNMLDSKPEVRGR